MNPTIPWMSLVGAALILSLSFPATATVYTWTDPQGIRHYSNVEPPRDLPFEILDPPGSQPVLPRETRPFELVKVFDGDTLRITFMAMDLMVRLVGIDAPETGHRGAKGQPFSRRATDQLTRWLGQGDLRLRAYGRDRYNRILAEVFARGRNLNLTLVSQGLAQVYRGKPARDFNPAPYQRAEAEAKAKRRGIWSLGNAYQTPAQWRRAHPRP